MDVKIIEQRKKKWECELSLDGFDNFEESIVNELCGYFDMEPERVRVFLSESQELFCEEWKKRKINSKKEYSVIDFYNSTYLEIFELMYWHLTVSDGRPLNYLCVNEIAKRFGAKKYLDFGSGVGSGAIVLMNNGFDVTCADISTPLLNFISYRLKIRNLHADLIDLKCQELKKDCFEIITCFDVLEHLVYPEKTLKKLREALKDDGLLILNNADCGEDKERPMHIARINLERRLRCLGFYQLWDLQENFKNASTSYVIVLKKVKRNFLLNFFYFFYDNFISGIVYNLKKNKSSYAKN